MTSEVKPGPPLVMARMRSKERSPPMRLRMMTVVVAGMTNGRVMFQKRCQPEAPSIEAAS